MHWLRGLLVGALLLVSGSPVRAQDDASETDQTGAVLDVIQRSNAAVAEAYRTRDLSTLAEYLTSGELEARSAEIPRLAREGVELRREPRGLELVGAAFPQPDRASVDTVETWYERLAFRGETFERERTVPVHYELERVEGRWYVGQVTYLGEEWPFLRPDGAPPALPGPPVGAPPPTPRPIALAAAPRFPPATAITDGWATVIGVPSPDLLIVRSDPGGIFGVGQIGVAAPESQADRGAVTQRYTGVLPLGTEVWLQSQPGHANPRDGLGYRHVLRELGGTSIAEEFLKAGSVRVFPTGEHGLAARFADAQATAVAGRAGLWALTDSSALFRPRGTATGGLPVNPRLLPALQALDADNLGHTLLNAVNRFPVEIGVAPQRSGVWTTFSSHSYVIQVTPELLAAETKTVATALLHELAHVSQLVERNLAGTPSDCFGDELEALSTQALFWVSLHGLGGKSNPNHQLERELNLVAAASLRQALLSLLPVHAQCA